MSMSNTEKAVKDIRRKTRRRYSIEEKIRIVLDSLRGGVSVEESCRLQPHRFRTVNTKRFCRILTTKRFCRGR